jgi:hypothetical protein
VSVAESDSQHTRHITERRGLAGAPGEEVRDVTAALLLDVWIWRHRVRVP